MSNSRNTDQCDCISSLTFPHRKIRCFIAIINNNNLNQNSNLEIDNDKLRIHKSDKSEVIPTKEDNENNECKKTPNHQDKTIVATCKCLKGCKDRRCPCRKENNSCSIYCKCIDCSNNNTIEQLTTNLSGIKLNTDKDLSLSNERNSFPKVNRTTLSSYLIVSSWNIQSFGSNIYRHCFSSIIDQIIAFTIDYQIDILFIQETMVVDALKRLVDNLNQKLYKQNLETKQYNHTNEIKEHPQQQENLSKSNPRKYSFSSVVVGTGYDKTNNIYGQTEYAAVIYRIDLSNMIEQQPQSSLPTPPQKQPSHVQLEQRNQKLSYVRHEYNRFTSNATITSDITSKATDERSSTTCYHLRTVLNSSTNIKEDQYNLETINIQPTNKAILSTDHWQYKRLPAYTTIRLLTKTITFITLHLQSNSHCPEKKKQLRIELESLPQVIQSIKETTNSDDVILLGDFNIDHRTFKLNNNLFDNLRAINYRPLIFDRTNLGKVEYNYDNFWIPMSNTFNYKDYIQANVVEEYLQYHIETKSIDQATDTATSISNDIKKKCSDHSPIVMGINLIAFK